MSEAVIGERGALGSRVDEAAGATTLPNVGEANATRAAVAQATDVLRKAFDTD